MRVSAYTYPWDLARLGVDRSLQDMKALGFDALDLAATYHPIDSLSPREGAHLFTDARGAVYFPAREQRYGRIKPSLHSPELCAVWPQVAESARSLGLDLNAWTVTLFQPWIRDAYPDCARVFPGGQRSGSGVCPANDDVREYLGALCADVADQFDVRTIRLEGILPTSYNFDSLRPRVLVRVSPLADELLALCFCESCVRRATAAGLDIARVRQIVNATIAAELSDGSATGAGDRAADLAADAELDTFVGQHVEAAIELAGVARSRVEGSSPRFATTIATPFSLLLGAAEEARLESIVGAVDQAVVYGGNLDRNQRIRAMAARAEPPRDLTLVVTRIRVGAEGGTDQFQEAAELGVAEVGLYNYGLLRDADVRTFVSGVQGVRP